MISVCHEETLEKRCKELQDASALYAEVSGVRLVRNCEPQARGTIFSWLLETGEGDKVLRCSIAMLAKEIVYHKDVVGAFRHRWTTVIALMWKEAMKGAPCMKSA